MTRKIRGQFCERTVEPKSQFDKRSFRWKKSGRAWILVGCPRGEWKPRSQTCAVGTAAHKILAPAKGRCKVGRKVKKETT